MFLCTLYFIVFVILAFLFLRLESNPLLAFYEKFFPNKNKLKNKIVWVVGASTGIGEELAYQLAELNCRLILTSTTESKLEEVKQNCLKRSNNNLKSDDVLVLAYDISDFKKNDEAFKQIIDKFGDIDILCNNAARIFASKVLDNDFEKMQTLFNINFFASVYITKMVVKNWMKTKTGTLDKQIIATSSVAAYIPMVFGSLYAATKKSMIYYYRDVSMQHNRHGISVTIVCPGPVKSNLFQNMEKKLSPEHEVNIGDVKHMKTSRCCELMIVAMANKLSEVWICANPFLAAIYCYEVFGFYIYWIAKTFHFLISFAENRYFKN